jgi:hypothetical protein
VDDLRDRFLEALQNTPLVDRRIAELTDSTRQLLIALCQSRVVRWGVGNVIELAMTLGHKDGLGVLTDLLESGLLYPWVQELADNMLHRLDRMPSFAHWFNVSRFSELCVFVPTEVAARVMPWASSEPQLNGELPLPDLSSPEEIPFSATSLEADGLEWFLRMGALWQMVATSPLRRTLDGGLFKKDVERISDCALLSSLQERLIDMPDPGFWLLAMAAEEGLVKPGDGEWLAGSIPESWESSIYSAIESFWRALFAVRSWTPVSGWRGGEETLGNPFPSAYLVIFLLLGKVKSDAWFSPDTIEAWLQSNHPYWQSEDMRPSRLQPWVGKFLLGVCWPLRLVQVLRREEGNLVRLSPVGRWLLGQQAMPEVPQLLPRSLMVQPNLEILAFRQGLTPNLIGRLTHIAAWKTLGSACTMQLAPETVYRGLEAGESYDSIVNLLEKHGTRATPNAVLDALKTWANKRDRITIFPSAALLEFNNSADLEDALARGLPGIRLNETLLVVASEDQIDYKHFRLTNTRDYAAPPDRCVGVESDGVTLVIDLANSDLMLETEMSRFADLVSRSEMVGGKAKRIYRLNASSLARAREFGWTGQMLEQWFLQRTGQMVSASAKLLLTAAQYAPPKLQRHLVIRVEDSEMADGLMQWKPTRELISERLGADALSVTEENLPKLRETLSELGVRIEE